MIWDVHCHLAGVNGATPAERLGQLIAFADRMGIERICVFMGMKWSHDPSADDFRRQNDEVLAALERWPDRAIGFVYLNPNHVEASLAEMDRCVRDGPMVGVKLWVARRCNSPELDPILKRALELKAVVLQHTYLKAAGNLPGESTPTDLAYLAQRHPSVPIICGHTGADWELGIRSIRPFKNVCVELSGFDPAAGVTELAVNELGPERVLFGSDAGGRSFASQLGKVLGAQISDQAKRLILGQNLKRLLTPIFNQKATKR
jgi:uncharacterized protein